MSVIDNWMVRTLWRSLRAVSAGLHTLLHRHDTRELDESVIVSVTEYWMVRNFLCAVVQGVC